MDLRRMNMIRSARRLVDDCLNLKAGENFLVLVDTVTSPMGEIFAYLGQERGAETCVLVYPPRTRHGEELPRIVAQAMKAADAIIAPTIFSVNHTTARAEASKAGARLVFMPGVTMEVFESGSLDVDYPAIAQRIHALGDILENGSTIRVTGPAGTDFIANIAGMHAVPQTGLVHKPGQISPPPSIEVAVAPVEDTLEGVFVIDGSVVPPGGLVKEPVRCVFEKGRIVRIEGSDDARKLEKLLAGYDHPNVYAAVEIGFGMNPKAVMGRGIPIEDEAELGTMHVGIGNGITFGSSIRAPGHVDLVIRQPEVHVDGRLLMRGPEHFF